MADPSFTFEDQRRDAERHERFVAAGRRHRIELKKNKGKPWKVVDEAAPPPPTWEFTRDKDGKVTEVKQLRKIVGSMDYDPRYITRKFRVEITGPPCLVGGEHLDKGCLLEVFADAAFAVHGHSGRILEEFSEKQP